MASPIRLLFAGTTDTSGNATITQPAPSTLYAVMTLTAQCEGNPNWTVKSGGQVLVFGNGPQVSLGPILTNPGEKLTILITGASPSVGVNGTLAGTQHTTVDDAAQNYQPTPNSVTLNTFQSQTYLGRISDTNNTGTTQTVRLPIGTLSLQILPGSQVPGNAPLGLLIRGTQSRDTYVFVPSTSGTGLATNPYYVVTPQAFDTSLDITVTAHLAQTDFVDVVAILTPLSDTSTIVGVGSSLIASGGQDLNISGGASIPVVPAADYRPTPWQAPNGTPALAGWASIAGGANLSLLAATGGVTYYIHAVVMFPTPAGQRVTLQDTAGTDYAVCPDTFTAVMSINLGGQKVPAGLGLRLHNYGGVAQVLGYSVGWSS